MVDSANSSELSSATTAGAGVSVCSSVMVVSFVTSVVCSEASVETSETVSTADSGVASASVAELIVNCRPDIIA